MKSKQNVSSLNCLFRSAHHISSVSQDHNEIYFVMRLQLAVKSMMNWKHHTDKKYLLKRFFLSKMWLEPIPRDELRSQRVTRMVVNSKIQNHFSGYNEQVKDWGNEVFSSLVVRLIRLIRQWDVSIVYNY